MKFVHATLETSHWMFHAYGKSEAECKELMRVAWLAHCEATGADPDYFMDGDNINYLTVRLGTAFRDDYEIVSPPTGSKSK